MRRAEPGWEHARALDGHSLPVWEPVTAELAYVRRLAYADTTLITQFNGDGPDSKQPAAVRHGETPTFERYPKGTFLVRTSRGS